MCDFEKNYHAVADQIKREDELIGSRINWLLVTNGFLFAAYANILKEDSAFPEYFVWSLLAVGLLVGVTSAAGSYSTSKTIDQHKIFYEEKVKPHTCLPKPFGEPLPGNWALLAPRNLLPILFCVVWLILLVSYALSGGDAETPEPPAVQDPAVAQTPEPERTIDPAQPAESPAEAPPVAAAEDQSTP